MQNSQEINWLLVGITVGVPSLIALIVPFITYHWITRKLAVFQTDLNKRLENYKKDLDKDLYQFQTKFSLLHQREADAIAKLYEILIDLGTVVEHTFYRGGEQRQQSTQQALDKYHEYIDFFLKNQIYFDDDLCNDIVEIRNLVSEMTDQYIVSNGRGNESASGVLSNLRNAKASKEELEVHLKFRAEFPKLRDKLRSKFRQLLSAENPNIQLEKQK